MFEARAVPRKLKLRMALAGPDKTGKTWTSLLVLSRLLELLQGLGEGTGNGKIAAIDTEHDRINLYGDQFEVYAESIKDCSPLNLIRCIDQADRQDFSALLIDSLSHEWIGKGGILEQSASLTGNSFANWARLTPLHQSVIEHIYNSRMHIICTMRSRFKYEQEGKGKDAVINKLGLRPIQRKDIQSEFDMFGHMGFLREGSELIYTLRFDGTRCPALSGKTFRNPGADLAAILAGWLTRGAPPVPSPATLSEDQARRLREASRQADWTDDSWVDTLAACGVARIEDLTRRDAKAIFDRINQEAAEKSRKDQYDRAREAEVQRMRGTDGQTP